MSCFCCQKEEKEEIVDEFDNIEVHFCSEVCKMEASAYFKKGKYINLTSICSLWMLLNFVYIMLSVLIFGEASAEIDAWVKYLSFFVLGLILALFPYGSKSMTLKSGIKKTKRVMRWGGIFVMIVASIGIALKLF